MNSEKARIAREELARYGRMVMEKGLVVGPGGNISARVGDTVYISPSGYAFDDIGPDDYIGLDLKSGEVIYGKGRPSSEWLMHLGCYRARTDIGAVVHTHPVHCIAVASTVGRLDPMFPDFAAYVGKVGMLDYIVPSTPELASAVGKEIMNYNALLLANHGAVTVGSGLKEAFYRAQILEDGARVFILSKLLGEPRVFSDADVDDIRNLGAEKYRTELLKQLR